MRADIFVSARARLHVGTNSQVRLPLADFRVCRLDGDIGLTPLNGIASNETNSPTRTDHLVLIQPVQDPRSVASPRNKLPELGPSGESLSAGNPSVIT